MKGALIYRRNDLFDKYMDHIRKTLMEKVGAGFDIDQAFPSGTPVDEIGHWLKENKVGLPDYDLVISDDTCYEGGSSGGRSRINLDNLFNQTFYQMVREDSRLVKPGEYQKELEKYEHAIYEEHNPWPPREKNLEACRKADKDYESVTRNYQEDMCQHVNDILQTVRVKPKSVLIVEEKLCEHAPFRYIVNSKEASRVLQACFLNAGIPTVSSVEWGNDICQQNPSKTTLDWIVHDRHTQLYKSSFPRNVVLLKMPLSNFIADLATNDLLDFSEEDVRRNLEYKVRERITTIEEK